MERNFFSLHTPVQSISHQPNRQPSFFRIYIIALQLNVSLTDAKFIVQPEHIRANASVGIASNINDKCWSLPTHACISSTLHPGTPQCKSLQLQAS